MNALGETRADRLNFSRFGSNSQVAKEFPDGGLDRAQALDIGFAMDYAVLFNATTNALAFTEYVSSTILDVNDAWVKATGIARELAVGKTGNQLGFWPSVVHRKACLEQIRKAGRIVEFETELALRGARVPHLISAQVVSMRGKRHVLWEFVDITHRKTVEAERSLLQAQLLQAHKMEAIGTLAGGVAHDFNNIIAAILGNARLAGEASSDADLLRQSIAEIEKAGIRGRNLVRQILSFSRREQPAKRQVLLAPVIEESICLLRSTIPRRIVLEWPGDPLTLSALVDTGQLQQVVMNLVNNAVQAIFPRKGRIVVQLQKVTLDTTAFPADAIIVDAELASSGEYALLTVTDDGLGMNVETVQRIFEPFFTTKPVGEGTGLGLSVVHGIVQSHDGLIKVFSLPGKGSAFSIYLPLVASDAPAVSADEGVRQSESSGQLSNGELVVYIDDDESLGWLFRRLLERRGFKSEVFVNPHLAIAWLQQNADKVSLVLTDYNMPHMSGLEVAHEVKAIRGDLRVAIASGYIDATLSENAEKAGVCEVIHKVHVVDEFCEAVQRLL